MKNKTTLLSFCIPTYNRSQTLVQTVRSISKSCGSTLVELVICDNASTDKTKDVIAKLKNKYKNLKIVYYRQESNVGLDKNILKSIEMSSSKYCWLLSDDDFLRNDAVSLITKILLKDKPSYILTNYSRFNFVTKRIDCPKMIGLSSDIKFSRKNISDLLFLKSPDSYFVRLGTNSITMSADIFNRRMWLDSAKSVTRYIGLNFIHIFVLSTLIKKHPNAYYQSEPVLIYTSHNARPWSNDIWKDYKNIYLNHLIKLGFAKSLIQERRSEPDTWLDKKFGLIYKISAKAYKLWQKLNTH